MLEGKSVFWHRTNPCGAKNAGTLDQGCLRVLIQPNQMLSCIHDSVNLKGKSNPKKSNLFIAIFSSARARN